MDNGMVTFSVWHILQGLGACTLPVIGWIVRRGLAMNNRLAKAELSINTRLVKIETIQDSHVQQFEAMRTTQVADGNRLTAVEGNILTLTEMQKVSDANYTSLAEKLEILPRIDESLKYLARVCATIVPRAEWELNNVRLDEKLDAIDHRFDRVID